MNYVDIDKEQQQEWRRELNNEKQAAIQQKKDKEAKVVGKAAGKAAGAAVSAVASPIAGKVAGKAVEFGVKRFWKLPLVWKIIISVFVSLGAFLISTWWIWLVIIVTGVLYYIYQENIFAVFSLSLELVDFIKEMFAAN